MFVIYFVLFYSCCHEFSIQQANEPLGILKTLKLKISNMYNVFGKK